MRLVTLFLITLAAMPTTHAACISTDVLKGRTVQILREGRGAGSGVLLSSTQVLTANHVLKYAEADRIWLRTQHNPFHLIRASLTKTSPNADLALLTLHPTPQEKLPSLKPLKLHTPQVGETVTHLGYAFAQLHRLGAIEGTYKGLQQTSHQPALAAHVTLNAPTFGGDSGGPLFTCNGSLAGIEFGNRAPEGLPHETYFITPQSIQNLLNAP